MSSLENIYMKMSPTVNVTNQANTTSQTASADAQRQIGREVAHELNNILTIITGYADRMVMKCGDNAAMRPELKLIVENARRAASVVSQSPRLRP
jgi:nitrogen-specific signal transduction histidine kinase